jgi:four helix bundle protein
MILPLQNYGYHKLVVFQKAKGLVLLTYKLTKKYPKEEQFILLPQMRRAVISIVANIVEGYSKHSTLDFARFLDIAIGSSTELELYFEMSLDLGYITETEFVGVSE